MTDPRPAPYPADTSAKGWRFELDYEQIDQSDTWDLAAEISMGQPALLMMWLVAWRQKPCGSFPADEAVIRTKCRIPPGIWAKCREVCMRGWWLADDGRLYHDTIVARVHAMLAKRAKDAQRAANSRARKADSQPTPPRVTSASRVTHDVPTREFDTKHQAPEPEEEGAQQSATGPRARPGEVEDEGEPGPRQQQEGLGMRYGLAAKAMRLKGMGDAHPGDPRLRALVDADVSIDELEAVALEAVEKRKGFAWALTALANRRADVAANPIAPKPEVDWRTSRSTVSAHAVSLGLQTWEDYESDHIRRGKVPNFGAYEHGVEAADAMRRGATA